MHIADDYKLLKLKMSHDSALGYLNLLIECFAKPSKIQVQKHENASIIQIKLTECLRLFSLTVNCSDEHIIRSLHILKSLYVIIPNYDLLTDKSPD